MAKFVSNSKNPYAVQTKNTKQDNIKGKFLSKSNARTIYIFRNNTANTTGKKVTFKHV